MAPTSKAAPDPSADVSPPAASASGGDARLEAMMHQAVGTTPDRPPADPAGATPTDAADVAPGSMPVRPALGALDAALGATLPDARSCLDPDAPISRATITFRSNGSAESVSVTGGAKGKPAEGCIRTALMRTRVGPFAQDTFRVPVTIRAK
jgi:hypothetical protein